ncbi:DivIVA domain-containing protein [Picosynechococcus sp. PCC 11901]|uniref:DivIVA domain-containing protein n=1 Tax=Picosynechococcus sp. PCC 11901 TaxID=2579791 RepID=UPI00143D6E2F|nr:DivIVA domain-containing protein [Picosynechococcus sp. PCC 11901]
MVQSSSSPGKPTDNNANSPTLYRGVDLNVQEQLTHLEEVIFEGFQIPLTGLTLVKDNDVLDQLDAVRTSVPEIIERAVEVLQYKQHLVEQAEADADRIVTSAKQQAAQYLDEMALTRQAEQQAAQLRYTTEQECQALRQSTLADLEAFRQQVSQEVQQMKNQAIAEAQAIQQDADQYAHSLLGRLEVNLREQLEIVQNGRRQLQPPPSSNNGLAPQATGQNPQGRRTSPQPRQPRSR